MSDHLLNEEINKHIKHIYDNRDLTFNKIKEIFNAAADGRLEGTEKVKGTKLFISFSVNDGRVKVANDTEDIKIGGISPEEFAQKISSSEQNFPKKSFIESLKSFEKAINGLDLQTQADLFGSDSTIFYNANIIHPSDNNDDKNIINYDTKKILIHDLGHNEYDKTTGQKVPVGISNKSKKLQKIISTFEDDLKHENFGIQINAIKRLKALDDKTPLNTSINRINSVILSTNNLIKNPILKLNDDSTINDYMIARIYILLNSILSKAPSEIGPLSPVAKTNIAKRLFGIKGISISDIRKNLSPPQFEFIKDNILGNEKNILKTAIQPVENIITDFSIDMLKNLHSAFIVDNTKAVNKIKDKLKNIISDIEQSGDYKDIMLLRKQMSRLKSLERLTTAAEGFIFDYDGTTYQFMGNFSPINKILNLFNKITGETPVQKINESVLEEIIRKRGNKYCLLSKKTKRNLGCYKSKSGAEKREKQVQYFKHLNKEDAGAGASAAGTASGAIVGGPFIKRRDENEEGK